MALQDTTTIEVTPEAATKLMDIGEIVQPAGVVPIVIKSLVFGAG